MKPFLLSVLICLASLSSMSSHAGYISGAGQYRCTALLSDLELDYDTFRRLYGVWMQGYISALNDVNDTNVMEGLDYRIEFKVLQQYCRQNLLTIIADAVKWYYEESLKQ